MSGEDLKALRSQLERPLERFKQSGPNTLLHADNPVFTKPVANLVASNRQSMALRQA